MEKPSPKQEVPMSLDELVADCPECGGQGWTTKSVARCCGGSDWECGARGCTGPRQDWEQEQCEYCQATGKIDNALTGKEAHHPANREK